ncbi:zinc-ribbon domain-containing protein [Actinomycetospora sp. NBC_00405]|uniref:zinc-ribbon domain-containing protein n=1 Tax=Actinomycetospora sp. NBC_00405 TaxID=2975952 RepID=UPI003FA480C1
MPRKLDQSRTLAAKFPAVAAQWHLERNASEPGYRTPDTIPASSPRVVWWRCAAGHEWQDRVATRTAMPKWKNGDIAACPECVGAPTRLVTHTYPGCGHTRTVQRKNAERGQQSCWDCGGDPAPADGTVRLERKRASALASYHRSRARGGLLTDEERAAQHGLVGFLYRAPVEVTELGLTWWRDGVKTESPVATSTRTLSSWLQVLRVSHSIALQGHRSGPVTARIGVHLPLSELGELGRWAPTFAARGCELAVGTRRVLM